MRRALRYTAAILLPLLLGMAIGKLSADTTMVSPDWDWRPKRSMVSPQPGKAIMAIPGDTVFVLTRGDARLEKMVGGPMFSVEWHGVDRQYSQEELRVLIDQAAIYLAEGYSLWIDDANTRSSEASAEAKELRQELLKLSARCGGN